ncbi:unnamed protein product [Protopolystoma xenopodis]|uniref:Uncharacterized protein n=1 Tax=Protopolystoma xenopodis TaxID=117903 RepID=A0A3S4ZRT6_9PLAT|nr:unnamed protein product [Protopolystoma xenopodis]
MGTHLACQFDWCLLDVKIQHACLRKSPEPNCNDEQNNKHSENRAYNHWPNEGWSLVYSLSGRLLYRAESGLIHVGRIGGTLALKLFGFRERSALQEVILLGASGRTGFRRALRHMNSRNLSFPAVRRARRGVHDPAILGAVRTPCLRRIRTGPPG